MQNNAKQLPRSTPLAEGVNSVSVTRFIKALDNTEATLRGFVLLRHGKLVAEHYWEPYTADDKNLVYSVSKSFTSTAVGLLFDEGQIDLQTPVSMFFPEAMPEAPSENLKAMTVRDLLAMNTGHDADTTMQMIVSGDWIKTVLQTPVEHAPGSHFVYHTSASYLLSAIVQKITGETVLEYLRPRLFEPLGFGDVDGDLCPQGRFTGGWGLFVRLEDLAKLGQLYLGKGIYEGKRILSEKWVEMATSFQSDNRSGGRENEPSDWQQGYGFQFWLCRHHCYRADGAMGQYCVVFPEQDAVLALMSEMHNMQKILDIIWDIILPGLQDASSPREEMIHEKTFQLDKFADQDSACFRFDKESMELCMTEDGETFTLRSGRGYWLEGIGTVPLGERSFIPLFHAAAMPVKVSSCFRWEDADTLEIVWVFRETPHRIKLLCHFEGQKVSFFLQSSLSGEKEADDIDFWGKMQD